MCRLLCVRSDEGSGDMGVGVRDEGSRDQGVHDEGFEMEGHLAALARIARDSEEYQGHGWGCAWLEEGGWRLHHDISPIWEDTGRPSGRTTLLVAHARSAFRDEGIRVENNMPFFDGERVFAFNGELHGVRIRERGRIGAEKVFNFVKRFERGDFREALERGLDAIERRTRYLRAANLIVADAARRVHFASRYRENPDYFQMCAARLGGVRVLCSEPYPEAVGSRLRSGGRDPARPITWTPIENGYTGVL